MFLAIAAGLIFLVLWIIAVRKRPELGFGIAVGIGIAWVGLALAPQIHMKTIPLWLPPLPFALVALTLFFFGFLAWFWGSDK
jgi:hypothetical protein